MIIIDNLKARLKKYCSNLTAYLIIPTHLHLIIYTPEGESISDFMRDLKRYSSKDIRSRLYIDKRNDILDVFKKESLTGGYKVWQDRFDDYIITSEHMLEVKMGYIHDNPGRAGLVKEITDWKYSSARNYYLDDNSIIEVGFPED
ncbi:MAG: hypothetical protein EHM58_17835 [Ignavibacteriae bacterium]|nr:MAG: hypothetical protein EHM58_17835 [Ignavibacteriota bacterium]